MHRPTYVIKDYYTATERDRIKILTSDGNDDPDDLIKLSLDFNQAATGLTFKVLDVDQSNSNTFDDGVEITLEDNVLADNETYMDGFEGRGNTNNLSETGNIRLNFGNTEVSVLEIQYFSTDDAVSNPGSQRIGISDLSFQV